MTVTQWGGENPVFLGKQLSTAFWKFKNIDLKCLREKLFPPLNSLPNQLLTFGKTIRQRLWVPGFLTSEYSIIKIAKWERKDEREEKDELETGCIPCHALLRTLPGQEVPAWALAETAVFLYYDRQSTLFPLTTSKIFFNPSLYGSESHCHIICVFIRGYLHPNIARIF